MGMFDSVYVQCPNCKSELEVQSKAGECTLRGYSEYVPTAIAVDLKERRKSCSNCGCVFTIKADVPQYIKVYTVIE